MTVSDFIYSSKALSKVKGTYIQADDFLKAYSALDDIERRSLVYHYIMDNSPFAFTEVYEKPLLFEQIRQYLSTMLDVDVNHVKLIGSTKTGFKMDATAYGTEYRKESDLDFMIIDSSLFVKLEGEFKMWTESYVEKHEIRPKNDYERLCWDENISKLPAIFNYGFVDTYKIPNRPDLFPVTQKINNSMSLVVQRLKAKHGFLTKRASMRVYKDVDSFYCQQCRNIESILRAVKK